MRKLCAISAVLLCLQSTLAEAVTIEPLPATTPQATHIGAFFPVEMGVVVRDDIGQPIAGAPVRFLLSDMEATTPGAEAPARFDIEIFGEIPNRMDLLSGQSQTVQVYSLFPQRIVVQVFAPNHTPVPYAGVQFYLRPDAVPSGLFEGGVNTLVVKADANGVAMAPNIVANGILGQEYGSALSVRTEANTQHAWASELFKYRIVAP